MNEPPGNRLRVALTGLTMAEYFRDEMRARRQGPRRAVLRRQHLPLHARRHRSVRVARPHAFGGGLPADARRRNGRAAGAHHLDEDGLDHLDPGRVRARGRLDRPVARHDLRAPGRHRRAVAPDRGARYLSGGGPARLHQPPARSAGRRRGALQHRARRAGRAAALQGTAGHHRDPRHGRAVGRRQADRVPRAQGAALPVAAVQRREGVHRPGRQDRPAEGHHPRLQGHPRRRIRSPARAGVLHGRRDRRSGREGEDAATKGA